MPTTNTGPSPFWQGMIGAGAGIVGQGINAAWQGAMNRKTRKWNEKMYYQQRTDSLADWNRMNEYNSPTAMMERFKSAGLNPNLIYGQTNDAAPIRSSQVEGWNPKAGGVDGGMINQMFMMIYDLTKGTQEIQNLKAQEDLLKLEATLKGIGIESAGIQRDTSQLNLDTQKVLYGANIRKGFADAYSQELHTDIQKETLAQQRVVTAVSQAGKEQSIAVALQKYNQFLLDQTEQRARIARTNEETKKIDQERSNLKKMGEILNHQEVIEKFKSKLTEGGSLSSDNAIFRAIQGTWNEIFKRVLGN